MAQSLETKARKVKTELENLAQEAREAGNSELHKAFKLAHRELSSPLFSAAESAEE
jgi:hypothetical protein